MADDKQGNTDHLHHGHRRRLRARFLKEGLEGFADHQVLELLLFYPLPRRDTNRIAHRILERYGSLSAALEADPRDLATIPGMGEAAAVFLSLLPVVTRRYLQDRDARQKPALNDPDSTQRYVVPLMAGRTEEAFYVLCLDSRCRVLYPALIGSGTVKEALVHPRHVVEAALRHKAAGVILVHNHPSGDVRPSPADLRLTQHLMQALIPIGVRVLDHMIVHGDETFSMAEHGLLGQSRLPPSLASLHEEGARLSAERDGAAEEDDDGWTPAPGSRREVSLIPDDDADPADGT